MGVLFRFMARCIYVHVKGCTDVLLGLSAGAVQHGAAGAVHPGVANLRRLLEVTPTARPWRLIGKDTENAASVSRMQCPRLLQKQRTLHGTQGKTADIGFIAHWKFPLRLSKESIRLAYYVSLPKLRCLSGLLCHGLPDRSIIEGCPPESITEDFDELFTDKIAATKIACALARAKMRWPARQV